MDKSFLRDWAAVATELRRIARDAPGNYNSSSASVQRAQNDLGELLAKVHWAKAFDFCERLHNHLAVEVGDVDFNGNYFVVKTRSEVQEYIAAELQRLFSEEGLAFEFGEGLVRRRGCKHTVEITTRADVVLDDTRLAAARKHYGKALQFFRHPSKPDYENCVKEAVCAVEAAGKALFPEAERGSATAGPPAALLHVTSPNSFYRSARRRLSTSSISTTVAKSTCRSSCQTRAEDYSGTPTDRGRACGGWRGRKGPITRAASGEHVMGR